MSSEKPTQKEVVVGLTRLDGTLIMVDEYLRKIRKDISEHSQLTEDNERRLTGFNEELRLLLEVAQSVQTTLSGFLEK